MAVNNTPTEFQECVTLVDYLETLKTRKKISVYTATAQETYTKSWVQKSKNKQKGVRPGLPDYIIVTPDTVMFIEMKRTKGNKPTGYQRKWISAINKAPNHIASVCYGFDEAREFIEDNL